jgi:hypothetical protein
MFLPPEEFVEVLCELPTVFCALAGHFGLEPARLAKILCEEFARHPPMELIIISGTDSFSSRRFDSQ